MVWLMKSRSPNPMEATLRHVTPRVKTLLSPSLETSGPTKGEVATVARWTIPNTGPNSLGVAPLLWASNRIYCLLGPTQWVFIRFSKKIFVIWTYNAKHKWWMDDCSLPKSIIVLTSIGKKGSWMLTRNPQIMLRKMIGIADFIVSFILILNCHFILCL